MHVVVVELHYRYVKSVGIEDKLVFRAIPCKHCPIMSN